MKKIIELSHKNGVEGVKKALKEINLFERDEKGNTALFYISEKGDFEMFKTVVCSVPGTGIFPQRLALLEIKNNDNETVLDIAKRKGLKEIQDFIESEILRMEYFE
jgi:ankyrin repeat protein